MNIGNKNFTNFQNIRLKGTGTAPTEPTHYFGVGGSDGHDTTLTVALFGGSNEDRLLSVANAGLNLGTGYVRMVGGLSGIDSTIAVHSGQESDSAFTLPHRSGKIGICGTFVVHLEAISAASPYQTHVVVSGIREEDALVCSIQKGNTTITTRGFYVLGGVRNTNSGINLTFYNPTATATIAESPVIAYASVR